MKLIFLHASQKLILRFWWGWSSILKVPKMTSLQCLYNISKMKLEMKLIFSMQISFSKVDFNTFGIKVSYKVMLSLLMDMIKISQSTQVTSLQCLYNISKKKLGMEFIFCLQINIKVPTSWHYRFWWRWPQMSKVPEIGSW